MHSHSHPNLECRGRDDAAHHYQNLQTRADTEHGPALFSARIEGWADGRTRTRAHTNALMHVHGCGSYQDASKDTHRPQKGHVRAFAHPRRRMLLMDPPTMRPSFHPTDRPTDRPTDGPTDRRTDRSVGRSVGRSFRWFVGPSVRASRSVGPSARPSMCAHTRTGGAQCER